MSLFKIFSFVGAGLCLIVSLILWLDGTFNDSFTAFSWSMIGVFAIACVILFIAPFAFPSQSRDAEIAEQFADAPESGPRRGSARSLRGTGNGTLEERMEARRRRVAAAKSASPSETTKPIQEEGEAENFDATFMGLDRFRLLILTGTSTFLLGAGSFFYLMSPAGSPATIISSYPLISAAVLLFILSLAWRISRTMTNLLIGTKSSWHPSPTKRKPYTDERMARRKERLEQARRDGKI